MQIDKFNVYKQNNSEHSIEEEFFKRYFEDAKTLMLEVVRNNPRIQSYKHLCYLRLFARKHLDHLATETANVKGYDRSKRRIFCRARTGYNGYKITNLHVIKTANHKEAKKRKLGRKNLSQWSTKNYHIPAEKLKSFQQKRDHPCPRGNCPSENSAEINHGCCGKAATK